MTSQDIPSSEGKQNRTSGWRRLASVVAVGGLALVSSLAAPVASADDGTSTPAVVETTDAATAPSLAEPSVESSESSASSSTADEVTPIDGVAEAVAEEDAQPDVAAPEPDSAP